MSFIYRFTTRQEPLPRIAHMLGVKNPPITRFVEYDLVNQRGHVYYPAEMSGQRARCLHDPIEMTSANDLAVRMLGWLEDGKEYISPGWGTDRTCEQDTDRRCEYLEILGEYLNREDDDA